MLGVVWSATGLGLPSAVASSLGLLSSAAVPAALVALGASLYSEKQPLLAARTEISAITVLKLVAQPLIAWAIGLLLHLSPPALLAVVVCAGLPTAQNTFIFAQEYGVGEALASRAVVVTTTLSLASLATIAALLGHS
jgi:predicted permease